MATKQIWTDLDGVNIGILKNWRHNPLSTIQRNALGLLLNTQNKALQVFDTDENLQYFWNGTQWVSGAVGSSQEIIFGEIPTGIINGINTTFTTAFNFVLGKIDVYVNGLKQKKTYFSELGTTTIILDDAPETSDIVEVNYIKQ